MPDLDGGPNDMQEFRRRLDSLETWVADLDRDVADNRAERRAQTRTLNALRTNQVEQSRTLREVADQVGRLTIDHLRLAERVDGLDSKVDGLDSKVDALDSKVDALDSKVDALDSKVDALDSKVDGLDRRFDDLGQQFDGLNRRVGGLGQQFGGLDSRVDGLAVAVHEILRRLPDPGPAADRL